MGEITTSYLRPEVLWREREREARPSLNIADRSTRNVSSIKRNLANGTFIWSGLEA